MKGLPGKQDKTKQKPCIVTQMALPYQGETDPTLAGTEILRVDTEFCEVIEF